MTPPVARRLPHVHPRHHGDVTDDYHWLRDRDDPATLALLEAENVAADAFFAPLKPTIDAIFGEIKARTQETDLSVPARKGPWWYASRTVEGQSYAIHERWPSRDSIDAGEPGQVLLDENAEADGHDYHAVGAFDVSPSGRYLAWSADRDGGEVYELRIRDLDSGHDLPDRIERTYYGTAWSADDRFVFYTVPDDAMRPFQVWRHEVGQSDATNDVCVFEEPDQRYNVGLGTTKSDVWIVITVESRVTTEVLVLAAEDPTAEPQLIAARRDGIEYHVEHQGDRFVILTNDDALDFRVVSAPITSPGPDHWTDLLPHRPGTRVDDIDVFADHVVVHEWSQAQPQLRVLGSDGTQRVLHFDEDVYDIESGTNPEHETSTLRFRFSSFLTPSTVYDEDLRTGARTLLKQTPVLGGYDPARYLATREWAIAPDGTKVPLEIVRRRDVTADGTNPVLLYGYGSYEASLPPWFSIARLSLLDRGVVYVLAHPRGGGEMGRAWYEHGKLLEKRNTFTDFFACAEHLVQHGWSAPDRIAIRGGSAGGLLVGATVNLAPDRFRAVIAEVPFVDVVTTMLDETLPLTVAEWDEWGNPNDPEYEAYITSYSPYDNIRPGVAYPAMYVTAGLNDPRVSYHEPAKWVAKLRAQTNVGPDNPIAFRTELGAGHGGPSGRYEAWRDEARTLAFVLWALGVR